MRRKCAPLTCVYTCVVETEACPNSSWMARRSAPLSSMCVAYACRNMCGDAESIPASRLYFTTRRRMSEVRSARPRRESSSSASRRADRSLGGHRVCESALPLQLAAPALEVAAQRGRRLVAQGDDPHLAALAVHDELRLGRLHVPQTQRHELHAAQAAPVEQFQDDPVAQRERIGALGRRDQGVHVRHAEDARQAPAPARPGQAARRIGGEHAGLGEVPREAAQRRELPRERGRRVAATPELGGEGTHLAPPEVGDREVAPGQPLEQLLQVGRVGAASRRTRAAHLEVTQERAAGSVRIGFRRGRVGRLGLFRTELARSCHQVPPEAT